MTCSNITTYSLPAEIDIDGTFDIVIGLEGVACESHPNPDYIFAGVADVDVDPNRYRGWITTAQVDPGWTLTINQVLLLKAFYKDLTDLDEIPDVLHWKIATGPADPETAMFTVTDSTPVQDINVIKPMKLPLAWIALAATAVGMSAVGIVSYKKWG